MNISYLVSLVGLRMTDYVFGNILLAGIFLVLIMIIFCWKMGIPADGSVVIIGLTILVLSTALMLPFSNLMTLFIYIGMVAVIMFVVYMRFFRG